MVRARSILAALLVALAIGSPVRGETLAFVTAQSPIHALLVYDVDTMTERARITGFGIEPSRMVANPDRSRVYLVSRLSASPPQPAEMRVHVVSTAQRRILRSAVVGEGTGRAIAISPDGGRLYVWKLTASTETFGVAVLDAATLAEVGFVPLPWASCRLGARDLLVAPDGRIVASGCSDGLRVIDPLTQVATTLTPFTDLANDLIGLSPDGQEVYQRSLTQASSFDPRLAAIDLASGARGDVAFALPPSSPALLGVAVRAFQVPNAANGAAGPLVFVTYGSPTGAGSPPIASALADALAPPQRRLTRLTSLGTPSATIVGLDEFGVVGVFANSRFLRRVRVDALAAEPIAAEGSAVAVAPSGTPLQLSDIVVARPLLEDGFE